MTNQSNPRRSFYRQLVDAVKWLFSEDPSSTASPRTAPARPGRGGRPPRGQQAQRQPRQQRPAAAIVPRPTVFPSVAGTTGEQSIARSNLYQWLASVPHREYGPAVADFREALEDDPDFVARACVWLNRPESGQQIRDVQDVACITLLQAPSAFPNYREAGRCTLLGQDVYGGCGTSGLPPYRLFRVVEFVAASDRQVPRLMRAVVNDYFAALERDPARLDGAALRNRRAMKAAWRSYHLKPGNYPRAHAILFGQPPPDSRLAALKSIAAMDDPTAQARAIVENRIPYVVATSVIREWTPAVGVALIEAMSPTEAVNSRAWIERAGLLQHPQVRDLYLSKVERARGSVAAMTHRQSARGEDEAVQAAVERARERAVAASRRIQRDMLLLVDKSGSMQQAIAAAQQFGSRIGPLCDGRLMAVAFDTDAREITVEEPARLASWEAAFRGVRASGSTSIGAGLKYALDRGFQPHQVVIITDTGENTQPLLLDVASRFAEPPDFVFIVLPGERGLVMQQLRQNGHRVEVFEISDPGDYWIYDQVTAVLGGPPAKSLVEQILETELPRRAR